MRIKYFLPFLLIFSFVGCGQDPEIKFTKPKIQVPKEQPIVKRNKGSLYAVKGSSLFADKKDLQIGDIIQVQIDESLYSNSHNKRELSNDRNSSLGGGVVTAGQNNGLASKIAKSLNPVTNLGFESNSSVENDGEVKTKLDETFSTSVSAIIEETYQNGNYYISGTKEILIDGQKQSLTLTGVIRPYDITSDNSVDSSQIANLKILYEKDGEEQDVMHVPWGLKIIQLFWPF
ncbi:flagellar basal body L-ring protein FlgH [Halarcobacter anaerophilus]|uniref:Flagellar L-ring protein n=1 Tax=Halarcobacter anaerophilus TaxID=877500 RepID=A0A4Q0Y4F1_9BACT|nr:flagellar basal body L-ring protein FlgH [Halarcobacter anaerophilus]QDF30117.1 flagellar outer membrane L-ring protein FlgH [Halarcobacter anaerophilus]RXJ63161.1 flagellar biosynthesis protein FlgH [Halarcobacter anaerophilus]